LLFNLLTIQVNMDTRIFLMFDQKPGVRFIISFIPDPDRYSLRRVRRNAKQQKRSRTLLAGFGAMRARCKLREEDRRRGRQGSSEESFGLWPVEQGGQRTTPHLGRCKRTAGEQRSPTRSRKGAGHSPKVVSFLTYLYKSLPR
jgi:hypothetical protein